MSVNNSNFIEFDGKSYAIDFEKLVSVISKTSETKDTAKVETWGYNDGDNEFKVIQRELSENTNDGSSTYGTIRYDLMKNLLNLVVSPFADENGNIMQISRPEEMFFGQALAFNTLVNEEIIIDVTEE